MNEQKKRLIKHGVLLVFLGLLTGMFITVMKNPRMGLASHLEGLMAGMLLILLGGCVWQYLNLSQKWANIVCWLLLYSAYVTWAGTLLGAVLGTSRATPIAGAGFSAPAWQETCISLFLFSEVLAILFSFCLLLYGLRGKGPGND
jgi:(hydroxyamino)benzene mutase